MAAGEGEERDGRRLSDGWRYCSVCRRNHDQGRKHIFTKQHKSRLSVLMSKFTKKVRSARRLLMKPGVLDGELEPGAKMWCYCCEEELDRHVTDGTVTLEWGGLIQHLANPAHHKKTRHYWWVNGVEASQLQTFLLFPAEYRRYRELARERLKAVEREKEERRKKLDQEAQMKQLNTPSFSHLESIPQLAPLPGQSPTSCDTGLSSLLSGANVHGQPGSVTLPLPPAPQPHSSKPTPVRITAEAFGHNLTTLERREPLAGQVGNVHSGATPPWMREDDDFEGESPIATSSVPFGPSLDEFIKHKERMRRAGKNPKRVGADFHLKLAAQKQDPDNWLPSFGRVWNFGPRGHSKAEFLQESSLSNAVSPGQTDSTSAEGVSSSSSMDVSSVASAVPKMKPYVRKRPCESSTELTSSSTDCVDISRDVMHPPRENSSVDSETSSIHVKPYVRKRKIMSKQ